MKVSIVITSAGQVSRFELTKETVRGLAWMLGGDSRQLEATAVLTALPTLIRAVWDTYYPEADIEGQVRAVIELTEKMGFAKDSDKPLEIDEDAEQESVPNLDELDVIRDDRNRWQTLCRSRTAELEKSEKATTRAVHRLDAARKKSERHVRERDDLATKIHEFLVATSGVVLNPATREKGHALDRLAQSYLDVELEPDVED